MVKSGEKKMSFNPCNQTPMDPGEEIVISGIAGRFPDSDNMKIFQENLMNKVDLVSNDDRRWKLGMFIIKLISDLYIFFTFLHTITNTIKFFRIIQTFL